MVGSAGQVEVYIEAGEKKTFAVALGWPGWARSGKDEDPALQALIAYAPRYARAIKSAGLDFRIPESVSDLVVVERGPGDATTDFGAPSIIIARDWEPVGPGEMDRWVAILKAIWAAVDAAVEGARGKELTKGPRGGGRELDGIVEHIQGGDGSYLTALGGKLARGTLDHPATAFAAIRAEILDTLAASARGEIPAVSPRGAKRWPPRYFVRRLVWHELDHVWEIEDRVVRK